MRIDNPNAQRVLETALSNKPITSEIGLLMDRPTYDALKGGLVALANAEPESAALAVARLAEQINGGYLGTDFKVGMHHGPAAIKADLLNDAIYVLQKKLSPEQLENLPEPFAAPK